MGGALQTPHRSIHCRGLELGWGEGCRALIMGVLNVTPDSFSDGGLYIEPGAAVDRAAEMLAEGADIIDVGGESSRPAGATYGSGATVVSAGEEMERVLPVVEAISQRFPSAVISVDTYKSEVAKAAVDAGARMINDITGLRADPAIASVAAETGTPLVLMHSAGAPGQMPHERHYDDVVTEVKRVLADAVEVARTHGVEDIIVDPGFGFGKSVRDNLRLVGELSSLADMGHPILIGVSRKATIGTILEPAGPPRPVNDRRFGSLGAAAAAILQGASIVRTHDVRPTRDVAEVLHAVARASRPALEEAS